MDQQDPPQPTPKNFFDGPTWEVLKIIASCALGVFGTLLVMWLTEKAPDLRLIVADTVIFQGDKNKFGVIGCRVANEGSKEIENIQCSFDLNDSTIQEIKVTPEILKPDFRVEKGNQVRGSVPLLNPGESFQISVMATNPEKLASRPEIFVRAKGATVKTGQQPESFTQSEMRARLFLMVFLGFVLGGCVSMLGWQLSLSKR
jgi:hypothetical protein